MQHAGDGFLSSSDLLGNELSFIATEMAIIVQVASIAWENGGTSSENAQWLSQSSHALLHRLLALTPLRDDDAPQFPERFAHC